MTILEALKISNKIKYVKNGYILHFINGGHEIVSLNPEILMGDWEPVIEKKTKTVVMYQVLCRDISGYFYIPETLYRTDSEIKNGLPEFIKLLTDRPIEVEVCE
jgi:hypothetical protein